MYPTSAALQPASMELNLTSLLPSDEYRIDMTGCPLIRRAFPVASAVIGYRRQRCHLCFPEHKHDRNTRGKLFGAVCRVRLWLLRDSRAGLNRTSSQRQLQYSGKLGTLVPQSKVGQA